LAAETGTLVRKGAVSLKDKPSLEWEFGLALRGAGPTAVIKIEIRRVLIGGLEVVCGKDPSGAVAPRKSPE
jgi:hypothetical protein